MENPFSFLFFVDDVVVVVGKIENFSFFPPKIFVYFAALLLYCISIHGKRKKERRKMKGTFGWKMRERER